MIEPDTLWKEKEELENIKPEPVKEFFHGTTMEAYYKANPDKANAEVLIHVEL